MHGFNICDVIILIKKKKFAIFSNKRFKKIILQEQKSHSQTLLYQIRQNMRLQSDRIDQKIRSLLHLKVFFMQKWENHVAENFLAIWYAREGESFKN